jgi:hypothetical protein
MNNDDNDTKRMGDNDKKEEKKRGNYEQQKRGLAYVVFFSFFNGTRQRKPW